MIESVLVANRGEIARRIFRSCRELGLGTVAVYADDDADAPHVREADAAVRLPGSAPADTYLRGDLIVRAALAAGADAVHPGYGFLSEHAAFARAVRDAGLVWIGPPPDAMDAMASKTRAKELMAAAGVPLLAPVRAEDARAEQLPLLVKAVAGGGGRGMRVVRELAALPGEITAARAEAAAAFGDGEVFVEPYVERGRHVEVQVLADGHGTVWALGTRDCSLQRRHQKVVEEAPAPGLTDGQRTALHKAAVRAARAVGYEGAGTVEFLLPTGEGAADGGAYFLEMNTRLQVEHPVTECVYGLDLVALQIRVAEGERLPAEPPSPRGHAVEARLYAEDPARGWQPQTGVLHRLDVPGATTAPGGDRTVAHGLRLDSGIADGGTVSVHYDPMLAKVIAWAPARAEAVRALARALERARVHGPVTNRELLVRSLRHPDFAAARLDTGFYDRHLDALTAPPARADDDADGTTGAADAADGADAAGRCGPRRLAALAAALADAAARRSSAAAPAVPARLGGWRNVPSQPQCKSYRSEPDGAEHTVSYALTRDGLAADGFPGVRLVEAAPDRVVLDVAGVHRTFEVSVYAEATGATGAPGTAVRVFVDSPLGACAFTALSRFPDTAARTEPGSLLAQLPGTVVRIADGLTVGSPVAAGQPLLWLEAMKMEHQFTAPAAGVLRALHAEVGQQVEVGVVLAVVGEPDGADGAAAHSTAADGAPAQATEATEAAGAAGATEGTAAPAAAP
ncbi:acety-l/propionyl-CoA carboxylase subunit alpha [Streptomyces armeniacus]|uniref:Acety-l/propionyl-CoA carboxylase subunit alpha n=1 Tax=Streptomyces armeniacus TaxID=83291 RepID=A0A345XKW1_9ACTN|nr:biotin carboxylase N-terminal domain-containing protein [Streptomyces armeniacus]AXK32277.1 acety-l/propionyl-CoA carboxylase subunit alpha [Streptomyces armeniacus]